MSIHIRKAVKEDMLAVRDLVIELAIYEKEPNAVTASLNDYEQAFEEQVFEVILAEIDGVVAGIVLFYMTYSTWKGKMLYLEDFVVKESFRKNGIGQKLFDALKEEAIKKEVRLLKWQVLDWNQPAIEFYKKNKSVIESEWLNCKIYFQKG